MLSSAQQILSLEHTLSSLQSDLQSLYTLLQQETQDLEQLHPDQTHDTVQQKLALTSRIEQQEKQFSQLLHSLQLDAKQPQQWAVNKSLRDSWKNIETLTRKCHEQNQINGLIIENSRRRIAKRLEILHSISSEKLTYSANGASVNQHASKLRERA